jgi:hypothetical protein
MLEHSLGGGGGSGVCVGSQNLHDSAPCKCRMWLNADAPYTNAKLLPNWEQARGCKEIYKFHRCPEFSNCLMSSDNESTTDPRYNQLNKVDMCRHSLCTIS